MGAQSDPAVWNAWYVVGAATEIRKRRQTQTQLLGHPIAFDIERTHIGVRSGDRALPAFERAGYVWTTLGEPHRPPQPLLEANEPDRIVMNIWSTPLKCSGLRIIDNVIDNAHFPFVHPGILGDADKADLEIAPPFVDEEGVLWSPSQKAWLPLIDAVAEYTYRIYDPYSVVLYIHRPQTPARFDLLGIFAQPLDEESFVAHKLLAWIREDWMDERQLRSDQQWISAQDKYVLERHNPKKLPLNDTEVSISVDVASLAYRQWLCANGVSYGAIR